MRLKLALLAAKFTAFMLKVFGRLLHFNGTFFPGKVALKICPDFLKRVAKPKTVIAVTGTDGKTSKGIYAQTWKDYATLEKAYMEVKKLMTQGAN